jgi:hypothetical protein
MYSANYPVNRIAKKSFLLFMLITCPALQAQADLSAVGKDKVKTVFKNVQTDANTGFLITETEQDIPDMDSDELTTIPAKTQITEFYGKQIQSDGQKYLVTLWNAQDSNDDSPGGGAAILAVFSDKGDKPLDFINVKTDISASLSERAPLVVGKNEIFMLNNGHFNAGENYLDSSLFHIHQGKLQKIDSIFTYSTLGLCESIAETLNWKATKAPSSAYPPFTVTVTLERKSQHSKDASCARKKASSRRIFSKTYHWDAKKLRYEGNNKEFSQLQKFNEQNL